MSDFWVTSNMQKDHRGFVDVVMEDAGDGVPWKQMICSDL